MEIKYKKETFEVLLKSLGYTNVIISETPLLRYDGSKICNDNEEYPVIELHWVIIPNGDLKKFLEQYKHHKIILFLHDDFMFDNKVRIFFI
jgi:hypothetical protein